MSNLLRSFVVALGAAAVLTTSTPAQAALLNGSLPMAGFGVTQNLANLGVSTLINAGATLVTGPGIGDYAPVPLFTNYGLHTIDLSSLSGNVINNIASFSLSNATYGSFAATSGTIVQRTSNFLDIFVLGIYSPGVGLPGFSPTPTSLRISINQSGQSLSEAITMNSPPVSIPEPASALLLGIGLAGAGLSLRRRQRARA